MKTKTITMRKFASNQYRITGIILLSGAIVLYFVSHNLLTAFMLALLAIILFTFSIGITTTQRRQ